MNADEHFVLRWPENLPLDSGAPLLCAGVTTYSPLKHFGLDKPGRKVGVVGLGGLGHVAVKIAKAFGAEVTIFTTSSAKEKEAIERLKADHFINSKDEHQMQLVLVGAPEKPLEVASFSLIMGRKLVAGSNIGGNKETQEMLDFVAKYGIDVASGEA
ncbi:putative mannitol dehydrogenase [Helianthus debilis subsp. tardiflorus]